MDEHVMPTYRRAEEVFVEGEGAILRDREGRAFLDFLGGIAVNALGHAHPELTAALHDQIDKVLHVSNLFRHPYTEEVASLVARLSGLHSVFFCNSGAEAIEGALKLARKHQRLLGRSKRTGFVALQGSFHGRTFGALSVTHAKAYREPFEPLVPGVVFVPPGDEDALREALASEPAALLLEPIQGEGGIVVLSDRYLRLARRLCDETGTILIHDEVQCGCGRTGIFLAADHAEVKPDLATLAKPIAAGLPLGLVLAREELAETFVPGDHGSTFGGGPLACRAALVFLTALENGLQEQVRHRGAQLEQGLRELSREFEIVTEVRGRGLMLAIRLSRDASTLQQTLYRQGLIANCTAQDVVRFLPPFVVTRGQIDQGLAVIRAGLQTI